jgi:hypothetical protein
MTADVSAHVDRLAGAALNVSRVDRNMKLEYLRDFEAQSNKLSSKVARVRNHACLTISNSEDVEKVQMVRVTCDFLDRLTPQVIAAARGLAGTSPSILYPQGTTYSEIYFISHVCPGKPCMQSLTFFEDVN